MSKENLETDVAAHPFLIGLSEHHIRLLADCAIRTHFEKDQTIFGEGETANRFYLIESGRVALESSGASGGDTVTIEIIGPGDFLARVVVALPTVRVAFHRTRARGDHCDLLLRNGPARRPRARRNSRIGAV